MADDSDIPPLEDMTDILQKAELIREQRNGSSGRTPNKSEKEDVKKRAKVTKKNIGNTNMTAKQGTLDNLKISEQKEEGNNSTPIVKQSSAKSQGMFGGMKKGFLFGGPSKTSSKPTSNTSLKQTQAQTTDKEKSSNPKQTPKEDIPFIKPSGKTESGLTMNEVQQAMSEAKGLLDNQEWITDDFLSKIEKNDTLLKRFSDPKFMSALQEFQTNPQAAMEKYKGNKEVETFLMDFCGLLGDHFTKLGSSNDTPKSSQTPGSNAQAAAKLKPQSESSKSTTPKIVELGSGDVLGDQTTKPSKSEPIKSSNLNTIPKPGAKKESSHIQIHDSQNKADIQEIPHTQDVQQTDDAVREVLNDPKVMETLMDPKIMALIKTLREDPEKGQSLIDKADVDLKEKVRFLVARGLLQFQMS